MKKEMVVPPGQVQGFGERLRIVRKNMKLKQNEFAAGLEISESYLCQIEKGHANPTYEFFYKLASKYNISIDYLVYGKGDMFFKRKLTGIEDDEIKDSIDTPDDLIWYMEHSGLFRMKIMLEAKHFLYASEENIKKDIRHELKKKRRR